ncbi:di-trans,poly-cis-decaprenylcistransferase [Candidatus Babeliales bacterium]|nr:di-trans,poly-cis-decaprenylcistransferase [Candidatus Babeliales bacterium]MCF7899823.1 di-trans,poly-cis-decaprenylcistransferase [Candidatus Babeliales bacterium]
MQHLAIIPDGNRRWAKKNKLQTFLGHKKGLSALKIAVEFCLKNNIKHLSFYAFSIENFNRSQIEKNYLFSLLIEEFSAQLPELIKQEVKLRFLGKKELFPLNTRDFISQAEGKTNNFEKLNLNILFCYSSKNEISEAAKKIAQKVRAGVLLEDQIDENVFSQHLLTVGIPDPDLIIRTSGEKRISNFLLFQASYSEFMFLDCLWPDITMDHLDKCLYDFKTIKRNFGY